MNIEISILGIYLIALISMMGTFFCRFFILPATTFYHPLSLRRLNVLFISCLIIATLTSIAMVILRSIRMNDGTYNNFFTLLQVIFTKTFFGQMMTYHLTILFILWLFALYISKQQSRLSLSSCIIFACLLSLAFITSAISHAGDEGLISITIFIHWFHIIFAASWNGSIIATVFYIFPSNQTSKNYLPYLINLIKRLSTVAAIGLLGILVTGIYNAMHYLTSAIELWTTYAGNILLIKLSLVSIMILLGGINKFIIAPQIIHRSIRHEPSTHWITLIKMSLLADTLIIIAIIFFTAILTSTSPSVEMI